MGRQITQFVPGVVASSIYANLSHEERLTFVRKMALAFRACWQIELPTPRRIGELIARRSKDDAIALEVGPDRHHGLGGPFQSVRKYLRAYIKSSLAALKKQQGIEECKNRYLNRLKDFVRSRLDTAIPSVVEDIPAVLIHADMGLHNVIVSEQTPTDIRAVIDWEFASSAPYLSLHRIIEMLFRKPAPNGFGVEYDRASELGKAFWGAIPEWERWNQTEAARVFLEWFRFGLL
jgi:hypothetical protein